MYNILGSVFIGKRIMGVIDKEVKNKKVGIYVVCYGLRNMINWNV